MVGRAGKKELGKSEQPDFDCVVIINESERRRRDTQQPSTGNVYMYIRTTPTLSQFYISTLFVHFSLFPLVLAFENKCDEKEKKKKKKWNIFDTRYISLGTKFNK